MTEIRPPIVVVLGHVDHGKTTLLDTLLHTDMAASEAGGITQSTRAFQIDYPPYGKFTFVDTPGHAAFAQMRSRGNRVADLAILVISAVDGVMPQTKESVHLIKETNTPVVIAINKIDLPQANAPRVKNQLAEIEILVEGMGGKVPVVEISAKTGQGITQLMEVVHLLSQLHPHEVDSQAEAEAMVLESGLDSRVGPRAVAIVTQGSLRVGQTLFLHQPVGKVRTLISTAGQKLSVAGPATPVEVTGLATVPPVGSTISSVPALSRLPTALPAATPASPQSRLKVVLKADVVGSLEAILASLGPEVAIVSRGTGDISESDIMLAQSTGAMVLGFNVRLSSSVAKLAETEKVEVRTYNVIYEMLEAVEKIIHPQTTEEVRGRAQIVAEFKIGGQRIAGCKCGEGAIAKTDQIRIIRADQAVGETRIKSLQMGKTETDSIKAGQEFGAIFGPYVDFKMGDSIIAFQVHGAT